MGGITNFTLFDESLQFTGAVKNKSFNSSATVTSVNDLNFLSPGQ